MDYKKIGKFWLLSIVDHHSKFLMGHIFPSKEAINVRGFLTECFCLNGRPSVILSDNGGEFTADIVTYYCEEFRIKCINGLPYHLQTQGAVEQTHQTTYQGVMTALEGIPVKEWTYILLNEKLLNVIQTHNHTEHSVTKCIPHEVNLIFLFCEFGDIIS